MASQGACSVFNCKTRAKDKIRNFRIPSRKDNRGREDPAKVRRQEKWIEVIQRGGTVLKSGRVCALHFMTGHPVEDESHPDWVPSRINPVAKFDPS